MTRRHFKSSKLELASKVVFFLGTYTLVVAPHRESVKMDSLWFLCGDGGILFKLVPGFFFMDNGARGGKIAGGSG